METMPHCGRRKKFLKYFIRPTEHDISESDEKQLPNHLETQTHIQDNSPQWLSISGRRVC